MSGPFSAEWSDFTEFDPATRRSAELAARISRIMEEDDTSEAQARWWVDTNEGYRQGAYTYRLCVFSNFLTTRDMIDRYEARLEAAFHAVTSGGVVLITGGVSGVYTEIYRDIQVKAGAAGLRRLDVRERFDPPAPDPHGSTIKRVYDSVWQRLVDLGVADRDRVKSVRTLWDPTVPYATTSFQLRAYRRDGRDG
jgi:hypothetical protein